MLKAMLRAHSILWHYLWVAPNILLLVLGLLIWKRGLARRLPAFLVFAALSAISELAVYAADVIPSVDPWTFWRIDWGGVLIVGLLKFVLISEIFGHVFGSYVSVAKLGRMLIRTVGATLVLTATALAAYAPQDGRFGIISGTHLSEHAIYLVESGLLLFIFLFASYFHLSWDRPLFGIALGLSISSCVHLATLALTNRGVQGSTRIILVLLNMAVYHLCVLIWFYFLLVPKKADVKSAVPVPEHDLAVWNKELERLLQQ